MPTRSCTWLALLLLLLVDKHVFDKLADPIVDLQPHVVHLILTIDDSLRLLTPVEVDPFGIGCLVLLEWHPLLLMVHNAILEVDLTFPHLIDLLSLHLFSAGLIDFEEVCVEDWMWMHGV